MRLTDQPGRVAAVLVFAPMLVRKGLRYGDDALVFFGLLLFAWDLAWLLCAAPKELP